MSKGNIITQIRCDVCGHQWFGCNDMRVNIVKARKWVQRENGFVTRRVLGKLIDVCAKCLEEDRRAIAKSKKYTARETQVLKHISEGLTTREIAALMGLNRHTISNYTTMLYTKTGALNREELYTIAQREVGSEA